MKHLALKSFVVASLLAGAHASSMADTDREWRFEVRLDGKPIGEHRYVLHEDSRGRELTSDADFRVKFLFIDVYRYAHRARERWQGDCLERLDAHTETNGEQSAVTGARDGDAFRLTTGGEVTLVDDCVQTFAYWNPSILEARHLLNPQTGEYMETKVMPMGSEVIGGQQTQRFRLLGKGRTPLEIDLWYTADRDWVALESRTPEGRVLRYTRK